MESQARNPEFRINPENFHPCNKCLFMSYNKCSFLTDIEPLVTFKL